jgi:hypothetical protein
MRRALFHVFIWLGQQGMKINHKADELWLFAERQLYVDWLEQRAMS